MILEIMNTQKIDELPEDILFTMMDNFSLSDIKSFCASSQKFNEICNKERFENLIQQKKLRTYFNALQRPITSMKIVRDIIERIIGTTFNYKHKPKTTYQVSEMGHNEKPFCNVTVQTLVVDKIGRVVDVGSQFTDFSWEWEIEEGVLIVYLENDNVDHTVIINGGDSSFKTFQLKPIEVSELNCDSIISELFKIVAPNSVVTKEKYKGTADPDCHSQRYKNLLLSDLEIDIIKIAKFKELSAVVVQIYPESVTIVFEDKQEHIFIQLQFDILREEKRISLLFRDYGFN